MYYDLHIHSAISPCANNDMTLNNIANMAIIKGLDIISITDHNTMKNSICMSEVCKELGIDYIFGVEIQTMEEVHVLAYFTNKFDVISFDKYLEEHLIKIKNNKEYFGEQLVLDDKDRTVGEIENLLLNSLDESIEQIINKIHENHGKAVLAHVLNQANGIINQLGFIPKNLAYDGIEVKSRTEKDKILQTEKFVDQNTIFFINSDAHQLTNISEKTNSMTEEKLLNFFWDVIL